MRSLVTLVPAGSNGPVAVFLFGPAAPGGGAHNGILAAGTFEAGDFVGPLAGMTMGDLLAGMAAGNAVEVLHTLRPSVVVMAGANEFPSMKGSSRRGTSS